MMLPMLGGTVAMAMMIGRRAAATVLATWSAACSASPRSACWPRSWRQRPAAEEGRDDGRPPRVPAAPGRRCAAGSGDDRRPAAGRRCSTGIPTRASCGPRRTATGCGSAARPTPTSAWSGSAVGPQTLATPLIAAGDPAAGRAGADDRRRAAPLPRRVLGGARPAGRASSLRGFARVVRARRAGGRPRRWSGRVLAQLADVPRAGRPARRGLRRRRSAGPQWEWVKWLPHALHPTRTDALGPVRLVASAGADAGGAARRRDRQPAPVQPGRRRRPTARTWWSCSTAAT